MEKNGVDTLHTSSGPKKHNHPILVSEDSSRKEKVKRLSVAGKRKTSEGNQELIMSSDVENELNPTKFKLSNKIISDSHPIHPASVPRKLRSAISERNCTSASASLFDTKRRKQSMHHAGSLRKEYLKKSKTGYSEQSPGSAASVSISKEEEEVAQTLFALAGMIPVNGQLLEAKTTGSTKSKHDKPISSSKDPVILKDESENASSRPSSDAKDVIPNMQSSPSNSVHSKFLIEAAPLTLPKLSERRNVSSNLKVSVPPGHLQAISPMLRACDERKTSAPSWQSRLNQSKLENVPHHSWQGQNCGSLQSLDIFSNRDRDHPTSSERRDNGLMSRPLLGSGADQLPFQSSAIAAPSWLHAAASSSRPASCGDAVSGDKVPSSVNVSRKSWKRCIAHVHISRLIQVLQMSEKDSGPQNASQLRPSQSSSVPPEQNEVKGDLTGHMFGSGVYNNSGTGSRVPMHVQHQMNPGEGSKNQRFDFFSLSSGAGPEANHGANRLTNRLDATQAPQLHLTAQASSSLLSNNPLSLNAYRHQAAFSSMALASSSHQVHLPMPPYFANAFGSAHMSHSRNVSATQPINHQQQQIWSAQLAAQFRPGPLLSSQIGNWQNRTQDPRNSSNHIQPQMPPAQSSLEVTATKYLHISQQQQQLVGLRPPLPLAGSMPQNAHLPSNCEDKGGRCRPDGVMPFQLLCNERL